MINRDENCYKHYVIWPSVCPLFSFMVPTVVVGIGEKF